jgi:hypothetical protein
MSEHEPRPSVLCMTPKCQRGPREEGECWLCPDCKKKLEDRVHRAEDKVMDIELDRDMWKRRVDELQQHASLPMEVLQALRLAADALEIAADWNLDNVQINPPSEWELGAMGEDPADGWCSTNQLARKLREIAEKAKEEQP